MGADTKKLVLKPKFGARTAAPKITSKNVSEESSHRNVDIPREWTPVHEAQPKRGEVGLATHVAVESFPFCIAMLSLNGHKPTEPRV